MDEHHPVPDSEASSSRKGLRIVIRLPTSGKQKEEVSEDTEHADHDAENEKIEWHTCDMCVGKSFRSRKALFGHMRLHSSSRKMKKEAKKKSDEEVRALDLDFCNTNWLKADKRGRKRKDVTGPLIDEDLVNAAIILVSFTNPSEYSKKRCSGIESTDGKLVAMVSSSTSDQKECTEKLEISGWGSTIACTDLLPNATEAAQDTVHCAMVSDNEDCGDPRSKTAGSYICRICTRAFKTHQALGGHVASHNKGGGDPMVVEEFVEGQKNERVAKVVKVQEHKCKACGLVFGSGQSLGGHMRKHYIRPDENDDFAEQTCYEPKLISDGFDGSSSSGKCLPDLDLNELPKQGDV